MASPVRTLSILVGVSLAGVAALSFLSPRYRDMAPEKSVMELPVESPRTLVSPSSATDDVVAEATVQQADGENSEDVAVGESVPAPSRTEGAAPSAEDRKAVQAFLDVRAALKQLMENRPDAARVLAAELVDEQTEFAKVPMNPQFLGAFRAARAEAVAQAGIPPKQYLEIRDAFAAWRQGNRAGPLVAAFDERQSEAQNAVLGGLEALDYKLSF